MRILAKIGERIKRGREVIERRDVFITLVIVLVGVTGFGLGRLSKLSEMVTPVTVQQVFPAAPGSVAISPGVIPEQGSSSGEALPPISAMPAAQGQFVGSRNSDKYHSPWCPGAQRITEANKVWFASRQEAEAAGYVPAKNCPGL